MIETTKEMTIADWMNQYPVKPQMYWRGSAESQMRTFRDIIAPLMSTGFDASKYASVETIQPTCDVISTHRSKSIELPVVRFSRPDLGLLLIARDNFYDIKVSVISEKPIQAIFDDLFTTFEKPEDEQSYSDSLSSCYFEGFPESLVFGYYAQNQQRFSAAVGGYEGLVEMIWRILVSFGIERPPVAPVEAA